jgi:hypothetical protein
MKSPKVYVRDAGIVHALLGLRTKDDILGHPIAGQTWESFIIESLLSAVPEGTEASFYRTSAGAEIDLVLRFSDRALWAIEVKRSSAPKLQRGFHSACEDLKPQQQYLVYPGIERFSVGDRTEAIGVVALAEQLRSMR